MYLCRASVYIYFAVWVVLAVFSYIYNSNYIYEPLLIYLTGVDLYYSYVAVTNYRLPVYFKGLFVFVFILVVYGILLIIVGDDVFWQATGQFLRKYLYILWLIPAMLSVAPVYVFTCRGLIGEREMKILFLIFFACGVNAFYGGLEQQMAYAVLMQTEQEEFTVTSVYMLLSLLPLVILFKGKDILRFVFLCIIFVFLVLSAKRGAIILGGLSILLLVMSMLVNSSLVRKFIIILVTILCLVISYLFINHQMESSPYFAMKAQRTLEGYSSGRDEYIRHILDYYFNKSTNFQAFWGIGAQGTLSANESFAHNDWLAILLEQGMFGFCIYLLYWFCFVVSWLKSKVDFDAFVVIGLLILIGFGKSLFSMYYLPISPEMMASSGFYAIALGYYLAKAFPQEENEEKYGGV